MFFYLETDGYEVDTKYSDFRKGLIHGVAK